MIRLVVMMYVRYPLSLRNVEDRLHERGIDICHETVRLWWTRFGPLFASEIRRKRVAGNNDGPAARPVTIGLIILRLRRPMRVPVRNDVAANASSKP